MKTIRKWLLAAGALAMAAAVQAAPVPADAAPDVLVKSVAEDVLTIIRADKDLRAGNQKKVVELAEAKVLPYFDFKRMTQLAVGKNWRQATPEQQAQLVNQFRTMLVRTYSNSLSAYRNQTLEYKPLRLQPGDTDVTVKTQVLQPGGQPIPVDYGMYKTPEGWKVYDVIVDGVSLVTTYRTSFATEIRQGGVDGLLKTLTEKNKSGEPINNNATPKKAAS